MSCDKNSDSGDNVLRQRIKACSREWCVECANEWGLLRTPAALMRPPIGFNVGYLARFDRWYVWEHRQDKVFYPFLNTVLQYKELAHGPLFVLTTSILRSKLWFGPTDCTQEIKRNANLMQQGNFIDVILVRHVSGAYAHHQEH